MGGVVARDSHFRADAGNSVISAVSNAIDRNLIVGNAERTDITVAGFGGKLHVVDRESSTRGITLDDTETNLGGSSRSACKYSRQIEITG